MSPPNLFESYFDLVRETEPPLIYHRWCLITGLGAYLGRRIHVDVGHFRVFPNHYTMLIGNPGTRKNTACNLVRRLFFDAGFTAFSASKTTKSKFLLDLEGETGEDGKPIKKNQEQATYMKNLFGDSTFVPEEQEPHEVLIFAPEFNNFLPSGDLEFLSDLGDLWDWDDEKAPYKYRLKNSKSVHIYQPTISLLAGNTHDGFQQMFPPAALGQGSLSRIILVHSDPSGKKYTFGAKLQESQRAEILKLLEKIKSTANGCAAIDKAASHALDMIYRSWRELDDQRFKHYSTRRFTHLLKLTLVCAAARVSRNIGISDVVLANTILSFTEARMPKALGEFGKSRNADAANKVMAFLYEARKPMKVSDIWKTVSSDFEKIQQLSDLLINLQNAEKIQVVKGEGFLPKQKVLNRSMLYVDYNLLRENKET